MKFYGLLLKCLLLIAYINLAISQNVCVDCSSHIDKDCEVNNTGMGYLAQAPRDKLLLQKLGAGEKPDSDLEECMNPGYKFTGDLSTFYCFWSPTLKCKAVGEKNFLKVPTSKQKKAIVCHTCASYCGCKYSKGFSPRTFSMHVLAFLLGLLLLC